MALINTLTRILKTGCVGKDVEGVARAMLRYLEDDSGWRAYVAAIPVVRRTWGSGKTTLAKRCAAKARLPQLGVFGPALETKLRAAGAFDLKANALIDEYNDAHAPKPAPVAQLVYPHDKSCHSYSGGYVHQTGGIAGNYALDFLAPPGTPVLAPEAGVVSRTSGNDPASGLHGSNRDVFGWSVYLKCSTGFFYSTHYGGLTVRAGDRVQAGTILGYVGDWPHDRGRSHTHLGFTSVTHLAYISTRKIRAVAAAPRVAGTKA